MIIKQCTICKNSFKVFPYRQYTALFCSIKCSDIYKIGKQLTQVTKEKIRKVAKEKGFGKWMKGKRNSPKTEFQKGFIPWNRGKKSPQFANEKNHNWKGNSVSFCGLHKWVYRYRGKPKKCTFCGKIGNPRQIHWANKSHKYIRDLSDFFELCVSCHKKYDITHALLHKSKLGLENQERP